jgi:ABC-type uncharacterized transport system auxiliary subunit
MQSIRTLMAAMAAAALLAACTEHTTPTDTASDATRICYDIGRCPLQDEDSA